MGWVAVMSPHSHRLQSRQGLTFGCRYVQRTLGQLGEDALSLPLVSRHLSECPACRAHRRRISRVDKALHDALTKETPSFFEGRWEAVRNRLSIAGGRNSVNDSNGNDRRGIRLLCAVIGLAMLVGVAWSVDHNTPAGETPLAVAPGISITEASVEGEDATVAVEAEDDEDGTLYMWLGTSMNDSANREDLQ